MKIRKIEWTLVMLVTDAGIGLAVVCERIRKNRADKYQAYKIYRNLY